MGAAVSANKTLFVTGASGFIGRNIVRNALSSGWSVTAFVRRNDNNLFSDLNADPKNKLTLTTGYSLSEQDVLLSAVKNKPPSALVHCAASTVFMGGIDSDNGHFPDIGALQEIMTAVQDNAAEMPVVIFGSALIYGQDGSPHSEDASPVPQSLYGVNKSMGSVLAGYYRNMHGVNVTELRLFNIYGTGDLPPRLIPSCVEAAISGAPVKLTAGTQKRDFVHVDDVVRAVLSAADKTLPANIYNVATGVGTSITDVAKMTTSLAGSKSDIQTGTIPPRKNEYMNLTGDNSRLAAFGLAPKISLKDGLLKTIEETRILKS